MISLQNYFAQGIELSIISFAFSLLFYVIIKCIPCCSNKKLASPKTLVILWYVLLLEVISLLKVVKGIRIPIRGYNTQLFAWIGNCFSDGIISLWQILLNFVLYIPLGVILCSLLSRKKRCYLLASLLVFGVSLANELIQYVFSLGIADIDDLLANTLGGLWGNSLYCLWKKLRLKKGPYTVAVLLTSLPLAIACIAMILYEIRPYGYLEAEFNVEGIRVKAVDCSAIESELSNPVTIYKAPKLRREQQQSGAQKVFAALHQEVDLSSYDPYDTVIVYRGTVQPYFIWYENNGFFNLYTSEVGIELEKTGLTPEEQMLGLLSEMGVTLPEETEYEQEIQNGYEKYKLSYDFVEFEGHSYFGSVSWEIKENVLYKLSYEVLDLTATDYCSVDNNELVYKQIKSGHFSSRDIQKKSLDELICISCVLRYMTDSKGFYRPVYVIQCWADDQNAEIITVVS